MIQDRQGGRVPWHQGTQGQQGMTSRAPSKHGYDIHPGTHNLDFNNGRKLMTHTETWTD